MENNKTQNSKDLHIITPPKGVMFFAVLYFIQAIFQLIVALILGAAFILFSNSFFPYSFNIYSSLPFVVITVFITALLVFFSLKMSEGLRYLKRWAYNIFLGVNILAVFSFLVSLVNNKSIAENIIGLVIAVLTLVYTRSKSSLFKSANEYKEEGIVVDGRFPTWAKIFIGISLVLLLLLIFGLTYVLTTLNTFKTR